MKPVEYFCEVDYTVEIPGSYKFSEDERFEITKEDFDSSGRNLEDTVKSKIYKPLCFDKQIFITKAKYRVCEYHDHGYHGDMIIRKGWIELPGKVEVGNVKGP